MTTTIRVTINSTCGTRLQFDVTADTHNQAMRLATAEAASVEQSVMGTCYVYYRQIGG